MQQPDRIGGAGVLLGEAGKERARLCTKDFTGCAENLMFRLFFFFFDRLAFSLIIKYRSDA